MKAEAIPSFSRFRRAASSCGEIQCSPQGWWRTGQGFNSWIVVRPSSPLDKLRQLRDVRERPLGGNYVRWASQGCTAQRLDTRNRSGWLAFNVDGHVSIILVAALLVLALRPVHAETGIAAFYGGGRTANGEVSGPNGFTAEHRTLPFGTCSVNEANRASNPGDRQRRRRSASTSQSSSGSGACAL